MRVTIPGMTRERFKEIDECFAQIGWRYNVGDELLLDKRGKPVPWEDVMVAMPDMSLNDLEQYEDMKIHEPAKRRARAK